MVVGTKIMLEEDYFLGVYDVTSTLFTGWKKFKKRDIFTIKHLSKTSKNMNDYYDYLVLTVDGDDNCYKLPVLCLIYFSTLTKNKVRAKKLEKLDEK